MIDTVKLFTTAFDLAKDNKFQLQTISGLSTGEVKHEKTFCNLDHGARFTIKRNFNDQGKSLFCEVSLPKLLYGNSLKELKQTDLDQCVSILDTQFQSAGAVIDKGALENMALSRLDYCKNVKVDHCITDYISQLKNCFIQGRTRTNWNLETCTFFNGSQEFCAYNKILETLAHYSSAESAGIDKNTKQDILRIESRLKKARTIQNTLKRKTFAECFNFDLAKNKLLSDFNRLVLDSGEQLELNFNDDLQRLQELRSIHERGAFHRWKAEQGTAGILLRYNYDLELIRKLLMNVLGKRMTAYHLKEFKQFISDHRTKEQRHLLQEIRYKLAA